MIEESPTQKQMDFIRDIEEFVLERFSGKTKQDASEYISRNIEMYKIKRSNGMEFLND